MNNNLYEHPTLIYGSLIIITATSLMGLAVPSFALPELRLTGSAADSLEPLSSSSASSLGESLEINCEIATEMQLSVFYTTVEGVQVPIDCLTMLRRSDDLRPPSAGAELPPFEQVADETNSEFEQHRNSLPAQMPLIWIRL